MIISYIMMNLKNIFFTTSVSFIVGLYSIYNIIFYVKRLEYTHINEIKDLTQELVKTKNNYIKLELEYIKIKNSILILNDTIVQLEEKYKNYDINIETNSITSFHNLYEYKDYKKNLENDKIICDDLCEVNVKKYLRSPKQRMETMNSIVDYDSMDDLLIELNNELDTKSESNKEDETMSMTNSAKNRKRSAMIL